MEVLGYRPVGEDSPAGRRKGMGQGMGHAQLKVILSVGVAEGPLQRKVVSVRV